MYTFTLDNGLRCVLTRRAGSAMAVVDVLYNVGSRDERRGLTGMAHLFEHLMFGGSANVPSFDAELERAGGNSNAWTSTDFTNFYDILPACNLPTALWLESDRMLALSFSHRTLEVQRSVVIEEFKQTHLNVPYGDLQHRLRRLAYAQEHPYSWPTIGLEPAHIAAVTDEDVRSWFYAHYAPDNAILSIVAPQPEAEVETLVRQWFGDIPRRNIAQRRLPSPGFPDADVSETVVADVPQPRIVLAYPMSGYGTAEYFAADTLTDILAYGRSGRFVRRLLNGPVEGLFAGADASIIGSEHEGLLLLNAVLDADASSEADIDRAIEMMDGEFRALARPGDISGADLERTLNNFEASYHYDGADARELAFRQALAVYHGEDPDSMVAARRKLTPAELEATASAIASRPSVRLVYTSE